MPTINRHRSQTLESSIYDDDYKKYIHESFRPGQELKSPWTLSAPTTVSDPKTLDIATIKQSYFYAHYRLKLRRVSPRTEAFLQQYRNVAASAMNDPSLERKSVLAALTQTLNSKVILLKEPTLKELQGQVALKNLVIQRYWANYGHYVGEQCKRFRDSAIAKEVEGVKLFTGDGKDWTVVQDQLEREDKKYKIWKAGGFRGGPQAMPEHPTTTAIEQACLDLGLDYESTRYSIEWYSNKNASMHCMVDMHIKDCNWNSLAGQLRMDLRELPKIFGDEEHDQMHQVLISVRDRYFLHLGADADHTFLSERAISLGTRREERRTKKFQDEQEKMQRSKEPRDQKRFRDFGTQFSGREAEATRKTVGSTSSYSWQEDEEGFGLDGLGLE